MKPVTWTPQMDDLLTELYKKATIREMTAILDVTYNQCAARIAKLGLKKPRKEKPNPPERIIEKVTCASVPVITPKLYRPEHIKHTGYTLKDISPQQCHWPLGDPKQPDFCYCGQGDVHKPYGYCKEHHELSIEKSNKVSKKLR